jgi:hypothetical protein
MPDHDAASDNAELKSWLHARLCGEAARKEWACVVEAAWAQLMQTRVEQVLEREALQALVDSYLRPERILELVRPGLRAALPMALEHVRKDNEPAGRWVPDEAKEALRALASERGLVQEEWIRALFRQEAVERLMADALYRGIRDFSTILPRIVLGLLPTSRLPGFGGAGAIGKKLLEDLERRLEPEIKNFLAGGTQKALSRAADYALKHMEDPSSVAMRKNMVDFVLSKSPSFHVEALTDARLKSVEPIVEAIAQHVARREETRRIAREVLDELLDRSGGKTVREALEELGIGATPELQAWAAASWPAAQSYLAAPGIRAWLDGLVDELLQEQGRLASMSEKGA